MTSSRRWCASSRTSSSAAQSGAEEWSVADVLSHLGSSSEIGLEVINTATTGESGDSPDNQADLGPLERDVASGAVR